MDFLEEKQKEIHKRLNELRPLVDEYHRLDEAVRALSGVSGVSTATAATNGSSTPASTSTADAPPAKRRGRPAGSKKRQSAGRRGRPRGSGTRAGQALELVRSNPGISIPELADQMGIKQNYLYRVMPTLAEQRLIAKKGRGWHARSSS